MWQELWLLFLSDRAPRLQVIEFRWAQMVFDRFFTARDLQFLGSEYLPCGHLPSDRALVFVENHDRQSNCHVKDFEAPCASLTVPDGDIYKVSTQSTSHSCRGLGQLRHVMYISEHACSCKGLATKPF